MLKSKIELEKHLEKQILKIVTKADVCKDVYTYVKETYNVPISITSDYITMRVPLTEASEFILFCILDGIEKVTKKKSVIEEYYVPQEIKTYSETKYDIEKIKFPIRFKMIQVTEDQWIGRIDMKTMMKLRDAQLINYNANAQRTMQKIIRGEKEIYKIAIHAPSVNAIHETYENETYIPTPFTLNIPYDSNAEFYYDEDKCELVVKKIDYFDITDGYHRYLAGCKSYDKDPKFDYPMELRIQNFTEPKSKQFVFQEDQKTKMRKVDSDSFNVYKAANIVTTKLNENPSCNLQGLISRNDGIINFGEFAELVHYFYFKTNIPKHKERSTIISVEKELCNGFNILTNAEPKYLEHCSYKQLFVVFYMIYLYKDSLDQYLEYIDEIVEKVEALDAKNFYSKVPKKAVVNKVDKIVKEVIS